MKRLILLLIGVIFITSCSRAAVVEEKVEYTSRAEFINELVRTFDIQIKYIREPTAQEYFDDVKNDNPYAMALINAVDAGVISPINRKIEPQGKIKVAEAKELINRAYGFKVQKQEDIWKAVYEELIKMKENRTLNDEEYLTKTMEKDIMEVLTKMFKPAQPGRAQQEGKIGETIVLPQGIKAASRKVDGEVVITLDWGTKSTGGYILKILNIEEKGDTIIVKYTAKAPGPNDMVTQVITNPKDSSSFKVKDINRGYKIIFEKQ